MIIKILKIVFKAIFLSSLYTYQSKNMYNLTKIIRNLNIFLIYRQHYGKLSDSYKIQLTVCLKNLTPQPIIIFKSIATDWRTCMENLVDKIVEIDKIASEKVKEVEKEKSASLLNIDRRKLEIVDEINKTATAKLENFEKSEKKSAEEEMKNIEDKKLQKIESLKNTYKDNVDGWTDDLLGRILKNTV